MQGNVQKWGNSLAVRIPAFMATQLSLNSGDMIDIVVENKQILIRPKGYSLSEMLEQVTEANIPELEWNDFDIRGREEW